jgi:hypothetical protein
LGSATSLRAPPEASPPPLESAPAEGPVGFEELPAAGVPADAGVAGRPCAACVCALVAGGSLPAPAAVSPQAARARQSAVAAGQRSQAALALRVILIRLG